MVVVSIPRFFAAAMAASGDERLAAAAVLHYNGSVNQAFARVLVAASSVAIGLWSLEIVRTRLLRRGSGVLGGVIAVVTLGVLLSGRLRLDVHGFGAVVLAQAVWLVLVGVELTRAGDGSLRAGTQDRGPGTA